MRVFVLVFLLLASGCVSKETAPEPEPQVSEPVPEQNVTITPPPVTNSTAAPVFPIHYTNTGCDAVVFVHAVDFAHANERLPLGFTAADLGELMELPARIDKAAIGLIIYSCEFDSSTGGPMVSAAVSIFVDGPVLNGESTDPDGIFVNAYELYRYTDTNATGARHAAAGWATSAGLTASVNYVVREPIPNVGGNSREPSPLAATTTGAIDGEAMWTGGILGGTTYHLDNRTNRFWHQTDAGISYDEYRLNKDGRGATSLCSYQEGPITQLIGRTQCAPGENLGIGIQDFDVVGAVYHLPGVHA